MMIRLFVDHTCDETREPAGSGDGDSHYRHVSSRRDGLRLTTFIIRDTVRQATEPKEQFCLGRTRRVSTLVGSAWVALADDGGKCRRS